MISIKRLATTGAPSSSRGVSVTRPWPGRPRANRVMILDGESGGPFQQRQLVMLVLKKELDEAGLFQADVLTVPPGHRRLQQIQAGFPQASSGNRQL